MDDACYGVITSLRPNLVHDANGAQCTILGVTVTPGFHLLGPLREKGGPTRTHARLAGSPGIDAGQQPTCTEALGAPLRRDQRGFARPAFGGNSRRCDLGAVERLAFWFMPWVNK